MIREDELIVDNFAGGGGASTAIERALGRPIDIAINHDPDAIAMHAANHPNTRHLCESVWKVDIAAVVAGRPVGLAWFSPDCTHFSKAKGGKPVKKKIRGLAWVALKWAGLVKPRVIMLENVEEFQTWGPIVDGRPCPRRRGTTFKRWISQLRKLGYNVDWRELRACNYGAPTIRKRLFVVARRDGQPVLWPDETHAAEGDLFLEPFRTAADCIDWSVPCPSIFLTKEEARKIGVNRPLADATMRRIARGVKRYVLDAAKPFIVNMAHGGKVESADEPVSTIATEKGGCRALVTPFMASLTHQGGDRAESVEEPFKTITGAHRGEKALIVPTLIQTGYGERDGQQPRVPGVEKPLGTVVSGGKHALVATHITRFNQNGIGHDMREPLDTAMAGAPRFGLCAAFLSTYYGAKTPGGDARGSAIPTPIATQGTENRHALIAAHLLQNNTGVIGHGADEPLSTITQLGSNQSVIASHLVKLRGTCADGQPVDEPIATVSAQGTHIGEVRAFLMKYYGVDQDPRLDQPMHTVPTKDRFALVMVQGQPYVIVDIGMRMLMPRELFRAQGFPDDYIIDRGRDVRTGRWRKLTKTAQVRMCGNSVSPPPAEALVRAQFPSLRASEAAA
jgi:DNA (cytosine-5)-methyltransferase 1